MKIGKYLRTIRYLKKQQVFGRIKFKNFRPVQPSLILNRPTNTIKNFVSPIPKSNSLFDANTFSFLNEIGKLNEIGWDGDQKAKLWRYNQHYFDDLCSVDATSKISWHSRLIQNWIDSNPACEGVGWDSYVISLRTVNWIKWDLITGGLTQQASDSLFQQVEWLYKRLEWHIMGNHLVANAKALIFAGIYFNGDGAEKWLNEGLSILHTELSEQILPDGAHFELSPMYHSIFTEDLLDIINILQSKVIKTLKIEKNLINDLKIKVKALLIWLEATSHGDGDISFFNDSALGIAARHSVLREYADRLEIKQDNQKKGNKFFPDSGMVILENEKEKLIADFGRIGPDYLPGHAHAGTFSFELSVGDERLIVNSGTSTYEICEERLRQRGTKAHNTLAINGKNSSEVWSSFRVGSRANIINLKFSEAEGSIIGTHDGFKNYFRKVMHTRKIQREGQKFIICDTVSEPVSAEVRFHIHPDVQITMLDAVSGNFILNSGTRVFWKFTNVASVEIEPCTWHPEFGVSVPNYCLIGRLKSEEIIFEFETCK